METSFSGISPSLGPVRRGQDEAVGRRRHNLFPPRRPDRRVERDRGGQAIQHELVPVVEDTRRVVLMLTAIVKKSLA